VQPPFPLLPEPPDHLNRLPIDLLVSEHLRLLFDLKHRTLLYPNRDAELVSQAPKRLTFALT